MPRLSARLHLLLLIAAAVLPVWLFAAYLLSQYAFNERARFEREALIVARQVGIVVEAELGKLLAVLEGLSKSNALSATQMETLRQEASRLVEGTDRIIVLRETGQRQLFNTSVAPGSPLPPAVPLSEEERAGYQAGRQMVGNVYASPISGEYRVAVALPVRSPDGRLLILAITVPTSHIRDVMAQSVPEGWTAGVGDRTGAYVARSQLHEETTGKPGLPEYLEKIVGRSGTFTSSNFQGTTLLAGYWRSDASGWFYTANVPLSVVQAPFWRSLAAIGAIGLMAMSLSFALAYVVGKSIAGAAAGLADRAAAVGQGRPVEPMATSVAEFAVIAEALRDAETALAERASELAAVLETVPAAVWFTYDPDAQQVIRNRFAAELMGLPLDDRPHFGTPDRVIDTLAFKSGREVSRNERPLTRAMRGELTDNEEFSYVLPTGVERILLSSARPILDARSRIIGAVQISLDITERKRGEEHRKLLVHELNHRVKNTLAIVQSIASQTLRSATSLADAGPALTGRLVSLAKAHDILTQESWSGADLDELLSGSVTIHAERSRFHLSGEPVRVPSSLALSLAMAFHELATNAVKYGALAGPGGLVSISWTLSGTGADRRVRMVWKERGGPPVGPRTHSGFGMRMLERVLGADSGGSVVVEFEEDGLLCVFDVPISQASAERPSG